MEQGCLKDKDFKDDCSEFTRSVSIHLGFQEIVNFFFFAETLNKS